MELALTSLPVRTQFSSQLSFSFLTHETFLPGSSSNPSSIYNSKRIFFRGDKTSNKLVGTYLRTVPLPERRQVCRNIKTLYEDDFVSRLLIYTSKLDVHAASTSSLAEQPEGKFGSYAECKACYAEIKLSDEESFDTKEWELHSAECLAREEEEEEDGKFSKKFLCLKRFYSYAWLSLETVAIARIARFCKFETQLQHVEMLSSFFLFCFFFVFNDLSYLA